MKYTLCIVLILGFSGSLTAQNKTERTAHFNLTQNIAIQGYDPVAYFDQKAQKGKKKFAVSRQGVTYYFASKVNQEKFQEHPAQYEPQYGGWCAYAMGLSGEKVKINPKTYKIVDGKLYLFYNAFLNNTLESWNEDEPKLKANADENWAKMFK